MVRDNKYIIFYYNLQSQDIEEYRVQNAKCRIAFIKPNLSIEIFLKKLNSLENSLNLLYNVIVKFLSDLSD